MKTRAHLRWFLAAFLCASPLVAADEAFDTVVKQTILDYSKRLEAATKELGEVRARVSQEKVPLVQRRQELEEQLIALQAEVAALQTAQARAANERQQSQAELEALNRNLSYMTSLAQDSLKGLDVALLPGELPVYADRVAALQQRFERTGGVTDVAAALDTAELLLTRVRRLVGGDTAPGAALVGTGNELVNGTFAFVGPEIFFRGDSGVVGTVRGREGGPLPVMYPLRDWPGDQAQALFRGERGTMLADPSGGKALRLRETRGSIWHGLRKGGVVGYVIMALGLASVLITVLKLRDLRRLSVDEPRAVQPITAAVARGSRAEAENALPTLKETTRNLFATGLRYIDAPRELLEEHFAGFVLRQRLHFERRLSLLAVIATAGPLLGLLGTVTGMIKTFTLITVFGTGSAGKLSGGISEALVATELGLTVAIPTLVIHGFLAHRIHKSISLLERYALEFATAAEEARARGPAEVPVVV